MTKYYTIPDVSDFAITTEQKLWAFVKSKKPYWKIRFCHSLDTYLTDISRSELSEIEKIAIINHWVDSGLPLELNQMFLQRFHDAHGSVLLDSMQKIGWQNFKDILKSKILSSQK
jgi:hypothetical protein